MILAIEEERRTRGWSRAYVSSLIGVSAEAVRLMEKGERKPSYDVLIKLLELYDYTDPRKLFSTVSTQDNTPSAKSKERNYTMEEMQVFRNEQFGEVRTIEENGKPLFCGSDVARALGYARPNDAISAHCRCTVKRRIPHPQSPDKEIEISFIPEGDVYRLIVRSKLPSAEKFERWVFDEVLPTIRKHGAYFTPETLEAALLNPDYLIKLATALKEETEKRKALEAREKENAPKVLFADSVGTSESTILVGDLAKIIRQNGVDIGRTRMFDWLRSSGYLMKDGQSKNMPTQYSMELGLREIKERTVSTPSGTIINKTPVITGKGQLYFVNKFLATEESRQYVQE